MFQRQPPRARQAVKRNYKREKHFTRWRFADESGAAAAILLLGGGINVHAIGAASVLIVK